MLRNMNVKKIAIGVIIAVIVVGVGVTLFSSQKSDRDSVTIGVIAPMTGEFAVFGENMATGIQLAKEEYERSHPGEHITVVVEDDQGVASKALSALNKLLTVDHIDALISATLAAPNDAMYEIVVENGLPTINIGVSGRESTPDNVFQMSPDGDQALIDFANYINQNRQFSNTAIVYEDSVAGLDFFAAFSDAYEEQFTPFKSTGVSVLRDTATKIVNGGFDAVVFLMNPQSGARLTKEILTIKGARQIAFIYDAQLGTGFEDYKRILGDLRLIEGALSAFPKTGDASAFREAYAARFGNETGFLADFGYDTFNVLINGKKKSVEDWIDEIRSTSLSGPSGEISFNENGVRLQPMEIKTVENGELVNLF